MLAMEEEVAMKWRSIHEHEVCYGRHGRWEWRRYGVNKRRGSVQAGGRKSRRSNVEMMRASRC